MTGSVGGVGRGRVVAIVVAVIALGAGLALGAWSGGSPRARAQPAERVVADRVVRVGAGPRFHRDGVGIGFTEDRAGAVAAALSYATAPQVWLYESDDQVRVSAGAVTVPEARETVVAGLVSDASVLRDQVAKARGTVWFVVSPLASRLVDFEPGQATVRVWVVRVLSADGVAVPQSGWHTVTFGLVWWRGDWRIASVRDTAGPVPQLESGVEPWAAGYLDDALAGFRRVGVS